MFKIFKFEKSYVKIYIESHNKWQINKLYFNIENLFINKIIQLSIIIF